MLSNLNEQKTFYVPEFDLVGLIVDPVLNSGWGTLYEKSKFQAFLRKEILIVQDMLRVRRVQQWHGAPCRSHAITRVQ